MLIVKDTTTHMEDFSYSVAEELTQQKNKVRSERNKRLNKDRRKLNQRDYTQDGNNGKQLKTYEADNSDIAGIDLRRVKNLSDLEG